MQTSNHSVLFVDDDPSILDALRRTLRTAEFAIVTACGAGEAISALSKGDPFSVVVSDMQMPGMNGLELLNQAERVQPDAVRMMLTGQADLSTAMAAVNAGNVFRFMTKPCQHEELLKFLHAGVKQHRLIVAERDILQKTLNGTVRICTELLSAADRGLAEVAIHTRDLAASIAVTLDCCTPWEVEVAASLARIGRISIPSVVLVRERERRALTGVEKTMLERIPEVSSNLLADIPRLERVSHIVRYIDKRYDGGGVPKDAVKGEAIPIESRILRAAEHFVLATASGTTPYEALQRMRAEAGSFDERVLRAIEQRECSASERGDHRPLMFSDVRVGDVLASDVATREGLKLAPKGTVVTKALLERMQNFDRLHDIRQPLYVLSKPTSSARRPDHGQ